MNSYRLRTFSPSRGQAEEHLVEAESAEVAAQTLKQLGLTILSVEQDSASILMRWLPGKIQSPRVDVGLICTELATLLHAGLHLVEAMDALAARESSGDAGIYRALAAQLHQGRALSQAMAAGQAQFPAILLASVRAAERTGKVADALEQYGRLHRGVQELRRKLLSTAVYPLVVVGFGVLVALFLLFVVIPRFASVYGGLGPHPGWASQVLIVVSQHMQHYRLLWLGLIMLSLLALVRIILQGQFTRKLLTLLARHGQLASWLRLFQMAEVFRSLSVLLRGGFSVVDALQLCADTPSDPRTRAALHAALLRIREGSGLSSALQAGGMIDEVALRLIAAGERAGNLPATLDAIADDHSRRVQNLLERGMRLVEPLTMIGVGLMVGLLVMLMYMPIFDLAGAIQ